MASNSRWLSLGLAAWTAAAAALGAAAPAAEAAIVTFTLNGHFTAADGVGPAGGPVTPFVAGTPYTMRAVFDGSGPSLLPPAPIFRGFVAYAPQTITLSVNGTTYQVATAGMSPTSGLSVALFDSTQVFFPGHYGAGFIANPLADGAGIVGHWVAATPGFRVANLANTSFPTSDFFGTGVQSGACRSGPGPVCVGGHEVTPIPMTLGGAPFQLVLGTYAVNGPLADPNDPRYRPGPPTLPFSAALAVPAPSSLAVLSVTLLGLCAARRRRARA